MRQAQSPTPNTSSSITWRSAGLFAVRYGIGGVMVLAGVVALIVIGGEVGAFGFASATGAGLSVVLLNLLYRLSVSSDREREREEEARRYLDDHGVWPDDDEADTDTHPSVGRSPTGRARVAAGGPARGREPSSGGRPREAVTPPQQTKQDRSGCPA